MLISYKLLLSVIAALSLAIIIEILGHHQYLNTLMPMSSQKENNDVVIELSQKQLYKLIRGNYYYKYTGVNTTYQGDKAKAFCINNNLEIILDHYKNQYNSFIVNPFTIQTDTTAFEGITFSPESKNIIFNQYDKGIYTITPTLNKVYIEKMNNRFSHIYKLDKYFSLYLEEGETMKRITNPYELVIYKKSIENLIKLEASGIYPQSLSAFIFIHNPLTDIYSIYPDMKYYTEIKTNFNQLLDKFTTFEKTSISNPDTLIIESKLNTSTDLAIENKIVYFLAGSQITMFDSANIYFDNCEIYFQGTESHPIKVTGRGVNGWYISRSDSINIANTSFVGLSAIVNDKLQLPAAITIFSSNVNISNSIFKENRGGDDYINMFKSKYFITNSTFEDIMYDAIDSDFSEGSIDNSSFVRVGNDAIDYSGSKARINRCRFDYIKDKAISCGENSNVVIMHCDVRNSEIGIVCKDGSFVDMYEISLSENNLDIAVFQKKQYYNIPVLKSDSVLQKYKYLIEEAENIISETNSDLILSDDVEGMLYGNIYGKKSSG
jgi:hypothetical protein